MACSYKCGTCNSSDTCLTCSSGLRTTGNDCNCPSNYLEVDGVNTCSVCNYKCATCSGSVDSCVTCSHSERDPSNNCECNENF